MANTIQKESKIIYLQIGQNYENLGVQKQFDVSEWTAEFPDAHIYLLFKRPGEEAAAPVNTTLDEDGILTWTVSNWETGIIGIGFAEIRAIDSSTGLVKKSHVIPCSIEASVTDEDAAPDYPSWVDRMLQFGENVDSIYATLPHELEEGIASIQQEAQEQTEAIEQKGITTRASIPADYTTLSDEVTDLKSALSTQHEEDFLNYDPLVSSHGGTADTWYQFKTIPANTLISKIKLNVYAACSFRIGVVNVNQIIDVIDLELNKGENIINLNKIYDGPVTFLLEATANKLYFGSGTKTDYNTRSLAYNDMVVGNSIKLTSSFTKANFGAGIYISTFSDVNTLMEEYHVDNALHQLRNTDTVYNGLLATNTSHSGTEYKYVLVKVIVKANTVGVVTVNVRSNCTYHIALADCISGKIVYVEAYGATAGENVIPINFIPDSDCFLLLGNENNTIYYGTDSTAKIVYREINTGAYLAENDIVDLTSPIDRASFAFSLVLYSAKSAYDQAANKLLQSKTVYDGINGTNAGSGGTAYSYYVTNKIIQSGSIGILTVKVRNKCLFHIAFADTNTGEIKYTLDKWMNPGVNVVVPDYSPSNDCYVVLSAEANTMYYGSDSAHLIRYRSVTSSTYLTVGDTVNINHNASASFAFGLILCYPQSVLHGKIIFLAGDSRSSTDYKFYGELIESKTRGTAIVGGASGQVVAYMASNAYFQTIVANPHDFSIWIPGGNDSGAAQSVGTFSASSPNGLAGEPVVSPTDISEDYNGTKFIQAIDHIIRKYIAMFYDWKTLNNGHKPRMIMCTDLPQKRKDYPTFSSPESWDRKRQAIIEACEKNNIPYLDLFRLCSFDMAYEPEYEAPTDKLTNNGLYYMDGLHPNRYGMDLVTSLEVQWMKRLVQVVDT